MIAERELGNSSSYIFCSFAYVKTDLRQSAFAAAFNFSGTYVCVRYVRGICKQLPRNMFTFLILHTG